jgi:hypothetical protein
MILSHVAWQPDRSFVAMVPWTMALVIVAAGLIARSLLLRQIVLSGPNECYLPGVLNERNVRKK